MNEIEQSLAVSELPVKVVEKFEFTTLPEVNIGSLKMVTRSAIPGKQMIPEIKGFDKENPTFPQTLSKARSATSATTVYSGTLPEQGTYANALLILNPNEIAQVGLKCPLNPSLDYDLYLYEVNDDGTLGAVVASSTTSTYFNVYPDGSQKTIDEGLSYINKGTASKYYAVIVLAAIGGSPTDKFQLTVSIDVKGSYDPAEANDSVAQAYNVSESTIRGAYLNVINDQDWFVWKPDAAYKSARIALDQESKAKLEVYTTDGVHMILTKPDSNHVYQLGACNYIRVFTDESEPNTFEPINYVLDILPWDVTPVEMLVLLDGDMGTQEYPNWVAGKLFTFHYELHPQVGIRGAGGYPVRNHQVQMNWKSIAWESVNLNNTNRTVFAYTGSGIDGNGNLITGANTDAGVARLFLKPPPALGECVIHISGPKPTTHEYDVEGVFISTNGIDKSFDDRIYHIAVSTWA